MDQSSSRAALAFLLACSLGPAAAFAQEKAPPALDASHTPSIMRAAHGAAWVDGELWGVGPDYKVCFRDGGFEFTAALGRAAPRNFPLFFELESIERGGVAILAPTAPAAPALTADGVVRYRHPFGIEERYEVRADGVEQSFVFEEPLPGAGELVVRGRLATELGAQLGERAELDLALPDLGGVRIGAVTGVDARGLTARGSLRYDGTGVELVLPGAFVDAAAYPLVLDPLIGASFLVDGDSTLNDTYPDVAFDLIFDDYLVVWQRAFSASDIDIRAQRVAAQNGALIGGLINVTSTTVPAQAATVANVRAADRFLVAWQEYSNGNFDIKARAVKASDGSLSTTLTLAGNPASDERLPRACGDQTVAESDALVVWEDSLAGIQGGQVAVPASGNPFLLSTFTVDANPQAFLPAIARSGGPGGRTLVAYNVQAGTFDSNLYLRLLDRNGLPLTGVLGLATSSDIEGQPAVDGDGTRWIVAYVKDDGSDLELLCRRVTLDPSSLAVSLGVPVPITADAVDQSAPAVAWTPGKAFVAWQQFNSPTDSDVYIKGVDPVDCGTCEATLSLDASPTAEDWPQLASKYSGGSTNDQVFATWFSGGIGVKGDVKGQLLEAFGTGGSAANLGGGCGAGGLISTSGAISAGNPSFALKLAGADPSATTGMLVVHPPAATFTCGSCSVILPGSVFTVPLSGGAASQTLPIPCDASLLGMQLDAQWAVLPTSAVTCPLFGTIAASARLRLTIGQ